MSAQGGLGELEATAICGNDITSSCLYVSAIAILYAGQWAWVSLLIVSLILYFYRLIYSEVVGALPLNGGVYNALVNTTSKCVASMAACFTLLSYVATSVISATTAMNYLQTLLSSLPITCATIGLLALFMLLTIMGISESAKVAMVIFIFHLSTLAILIVSSVWLLAAKGFGIYLGNLHTPVEGGLGIALFFGFSAAMLGISGFESSASFVEEQKPGVFPKTLRNMWIAVTIANPAIAFLAIASMPLGEIHAHQNSLLSFMGNMAGGGWLALLVAIDATLVLSGAVLTSYVGVTGLAHRMALDRCLPQFLLKMNRYGAKYRIIITFFILCVSVLLVTRGNLAALAGVYTIAFLSVMTLFAIGNLLLKVRRRGLRRPVRAPWVLVLLAITGAVVAIYGNIKINPAYLEIFLEYFVPTIIIVLVMLNRVALFKICLFLIRLVSEKFTGTAAALTSIIQAEMDKVNSQQIVFFTRGGNLATLNKAMLYVKNNEPTNKMRIVTVIPENVEVAKSLEDDIRFLDRAYPDINIEFVVCHGKFGPDLIKKLSGEWKIPANFMFIGSPDSGDFNYDLAELGGVRLIV